MIIKWQTVEQVFKSFAFADDADKDKYEPVMKKFNEHFIPKKNIIYERAVFRRRTQLPGESVESFIRDLHKLAENAELTDKNEMIRDSIVIGILDKDVSEKLQLIKDLNLEKANEIACHSEMVKRTHS